MTHLLAFLLGAMALQFLNHRGLNASHARLIEVFTEAVAQLTNLRLELQTFWREHSAQREVEDALRSALAEKEQELKETCRMMAL